MNVRFKRFCGILAALFLLLPLLLGACQRAETPVPGEATVSPALTAPGTTAALPPGPSVTARPSPAPRPSPSPTPKPEPGVYRNTIYGFSIRFPESWKAEETGTHDPLVNFGPSSAPRTFNVSLSTLPELMPLDKVAEEFTAGVKKTLDGFSLQSQKAIKLGDAEARETVFTFVIQKTTVKVKAILTVRGTQVLEVFGVMTAGDFDRQVARIDEVMQSFRLEEPRPFGIPRSESLTLLDAGPITLDPAVSREGVSHQYIVQIFGGLVSLDTNLKVIPDIADRWEASNGGKTITFYLKKGVRFHDGGEVTAADFKYSWERAASPKTKSPTAETYLGDIVGVKDVLAGKTADIQGVKVIDDYTLQVTIDQPKAYFLSKLSYPVAFVVDRDNVERDGPEWWRTPSGTGPFKLANWKKDELLVLARNEGYHGRKAGVPNIVYRLWGGRPMIMYETDEIDVADVSIADVDRVRDAANPLSRDLKVYPNLSLQYIGFSIDQLPFDDVKVRQAFARAIDKDKIISRVLKDMERRADGILPPGLPGYNEQFQGLSFDVAKAKELIAESKYGSAAGLPAITLTMSGRSQNIPDTVQALIQEWKDNLGVQVSVRQLEPETFSYIVKQERDEMILQGWMADYADPENFLDVLFHSQSQANDSGYGNAEIDRLLERARVEQDADKRLKMYQDIEQKLVEDAAAIPLWFGNDYQLIKPRVKGYEVSPLGYPQLRSVSLKP